MQTVTHNISGKTGVPQTAPFMPKPATAPVTPPNLADYDANDGVPGVDASGIKPVPYQAPVRNTMIQNDPVPAKDYGWLKAGAAFGLLVLATWGGTRMKK